MNKETLKSYFYLMRLNKPIGILLLLWPTLWALWLASDGMPPISVVIIFMLGVVLMRSAGCIINDVFDRNFDAHVERTRDRPLATGEIGIKSALFLFIILLLMAFLLVLQLNAFTISLACVGAGLAGIYPYMKRITYLPQLGLGIAFAWGVPMAFAALTNSIPDSAWVLFLTAAWWPVIYDTMYAMVDREDDIKIGIKSTAILFGARAAFIIGILQVVFLILLGVVGWLFELNYFYYVSLIVVAALLVYQQKLINKRSRSDYFKAFLNNQWVGFCIFVGIILSKAL